MIDEMASIVSLMNCDRSKRGSPDRFVCCQDDLIGSSSWFWNIQGPGIVDDKGDAAKEKTGSADVTSS
jgi:hypothetical protein